MHSLLTLIKAVCLTIALGAPTAAFANVSTPSTIPPVEAPVEAPVVICPTPNMPTLDQLLGEAATTGIPTIAVIPSETSIKYVWDISVQFPGRKPYLVGDFDVNGCLLDSNTFTQQELQDTLGIVIQ